MGGAIVWEKTMAPREGVDVGNVLAWECVVEMVVVVGETTSERERECVCVCVRGLGRVVCGKGRMTG